VQVSAPIPLRRCYLGQGFSHHDFGLLFVERGVAAAAQIVGSTELNQQAVVATNYIP